MGSEMCIRDRTEGKVLENPKNSAPELIFQRTVSPEKAPNKPTLVSINFRNGDPIGVNGKKLFQMLKNLELKI